MKCPKCSYEPTMSEMQAHPGQCPNCGIYYEKFNTEPGGARAVKSSKTPKIAAICAGLILILGGIAGWSKYQAHRAAINDIETQVRLTSAYVDQMVSATEGAKAITFRELFASADRYVAEIDTALVKVSIVEPRVSEIEPAQRYMRSSQDMIRTISGQARAIMEFSNAKDKETRAGEHAGSSNSYLRERSGTERLEALDEQLKALESMKDRKAALITSTKELLVAKEGLSALSQSAFLRPEITEKILQK